MKKIILLLIFTINIIFAFAQRMDTAYLRYKKEDYLRRSNNNRKAGWILLGGGLGLVIIGSANALHTENLEGTSAALGLGSTSMFVSIPFFVVSSSFSHRAAMINAHVKFENNDALVNSKGNLRPSLNTGSTNMLQFPAFSLKVSLGK